MEFIDLKTQYLNYKEEIDQAIQRVLDSSQFILGEEVEELEEALAAFAGVGYAVTASSGTDTLLMALMALGIGPGDEVVTTPFTFISTVEVIALVGAKPVFVDIDPESFNLAVDRLEEAITPRTKALLPVSLFGMMPDLEAINRIADRYGLPVIEDGAQSFGAKRDGKRSCSMTTIGSTSFFPAKPLGCYGDGGALFTHDRALAERLKAIRVHGSEERYHHTCLGINGRLDALQAAILKVKLSHLEEELCLREEIGGRYTAALKEHCKTPTLEEGATHVFAIYTIRSPERDRLAKELKEKGIPTGIYYPKPIYSQPGYSFLHVDKEAFPETERACKEVISLPMHPWLDQESQERIIRAVQESLKEAVLCR